MNCGKPILLCSLTSRRNSGEFLVSMHHHTQSPHVLQSAIPSGVPYFTP